MKEPFKEALLQINQFQPHSFKISYKQMKNDKKDALYENNKKNICEDFQIFTTQH